MYSRFLIAVFTACFLCYAAGCSQDVIRSDHVEACYPNNDDPDAVVTNPNKNPPCSHKIPVGLAYSLPKGQVLLAAFRKPITAADVAKAQADVATAQQAVSDTTTKLQAVQTTQTKDAVPGESDAQKTQDKAAVDAAKAAQTAAQALAESAKANLEEIKSGLPKNTPAELAKANDDVSQAEATVKDDTDKHEAALQSGNAAEIKKTQDQLTKDQKDLDDKRKTQATIKAGTLTGKYVETFTLTPQAIVPDDALRYVANLNHGHWRDDTFKLSVVNGLLTSTNTQSTDQTSNIISSLASAAIGIVTFAGAGIPIIPPSDRTVARPADGKAPQTRIPPPDRCDYVYAKTFDPTNAIEVDAVNKDLHDPTVQAHIQLKSTFLASKHVVKAHSVQTYPQNSDEIDGLVYRAAAGVGVQVLPLFDVETGQNCALQAAPQAQFVQVFVPDTNAEFIAPAEAGALTTSSFQFNFSNGMLVDYNLSRPSEVASVASIPVDIVNKIMTIPTSILKLRLDYSTAQTTLATQNAALISAQGSEAVSLVNAKLSLETAETNLMTADINNPTARYNALTALVQAREALTAAIAAAAKANAAVTQPSSSK
jgi:hypothetical protein